MRRLTLLAALALIAGCTRAGPDYHPPVAGPANDPAATGKFLSAQDKAFADEPLPDRWWRLYADPRLDALVEQALAANTDLRAADANLRRAEAVVRQTEASRQLTTDLSGGTTLSRPSGTGTTLPGTLGYNLGISVGYPLDVRGKIARAIEASLADRDAVAAARDAVRISVAAATARAYADVCAANFRLAATQRIVALQRQTFGATQRLQRAGRGTAFDVTRAQAAVQTSEANLPIFAAQRRAGLYTLAALLGRPAADYPRDVESCAALPALPRPMPVGDGAALLRRRPDIRQAERTIAGDTARIGVATADLYPQINLAGSAGLSGLVDRAGGPTSFGFSLGPLISWSFPNRPAVRARIEAAGAQVDADIARFDSTVLSALRDTETALETYARDRDQAEALRQARDSAATAADQAGRLFRFGRSDFLALLQAQSSLAQAEASYATAEAKLPDDQIAIFLALGGGWE
ncbi:TolC family protein [Sphingomonas sp. ABOLD]|uniref:NodT family efflux transporter outer membrane factor (OMF) lipoprotein n=1 Tax=Sphingomonas trueperi TaxID=53317 RepID=A0A7X5XYS2_9SPHN|nr:MULTISPECIES: efflux transporter outer membrane subunit [Sphingomonas]NJB97542.1 NodT family efflux transporter outer membrane factor (OMF) lipoprotein [Sphingomonas trueperi]RSV43159.1 TolC family protein [Sphingomonas sp. ABOLE]RSV50038.1 TolC family protein [Sphingomonas sp. ABOLD]